MLKMLSRVSVELVVFVAIITSVISASTAEESWFGQSEFSVLQKVYDDCLDKDDFTGCLKGRALTALNKAINQVSCNNLTLQRRGHFAQIFSLHRHSHTTHRHLEHLHLFRFFTDLGFIFFPHTHARAHILLRIGFNFDCRWHLHGKAK